MIIFPLVQSGQVSILFAFIHLQDNDLAQAAAFADIRPLLLIHRQLCIAILLAVSLWSSCGNGLGTGSDDDDLDVVTGEISAVVNGERLVTVVANSNDAAILNDDDDFRMLSIGGFFQDGDSLSAFLMTLLYNRPVEPTSTNYEYSANCDVASTVCFDAAYETPDGTIYSLDEDTTGSIGLIDIEFYESNLGTAIRGTFDLTLVDDGRSNLRMTDGEFNVLYNVD